MVLRGAGEVGCAHCTQSGADRSCQVCTRLVCEKCAADWATCDEPSGRLVRLGLTARVRDIDPLGKYALVSHWRQPLRLFDLRALMWHPRVEWERRMYLIARATPPRLTASGRVIFSDIEFRDDDYTFRGMRSRSILDDTEHTLMPTIASRPLLGTAVSASEDVFYYVSSEQRVIVVPATGAAGSYEPLPRKVIQAVHIDGERKLMASATWGELAVHRLADEGMMRSGYTRTESEGNVHWVGIAGEWVVVAVGFADFSGVEMRYEARRLGPDHSLGPLERRFVFPGTFGAAAIARDGRFVAAASGDTLSLIDLDADTVTKFDEHTDKINLIRFAREDHVLVSADTDNRVILRPRNKTGYAKPLLEVAI